MASTYLAAPTLRGSAATRHRSLGPQHTARANELYARIGARSSRTDADRSFAGRSATPTSPLVRLHDAQHPAVPCGSGKNTRCVAHLFASMLSTSRAAPVAPMLRDNATDCSRSIGRATAKHDVTPRTRVGRRLNPRHGGACWTMSPYAS